VAELVEATDSYGSLRQAQRPGEQKKHKVMKGYMYILECASGHYYTGSTNDLERRLLEHQNGEGANFTKKHLPVKLVYYEEFLRIDQAFLREKQVQGWSRRKKEALINGFCNKLPELSLAYRDLALQQQK